MDFNLLLRNRHVARVIVGIPEGHEHIRARIESDAGDIVTLQEATLAAIVRAYLSVSTHPQRKAVELRSMAVEASKQGFAAHQLMEVPSEEAALRAELAAAPRGPEEVAPAFAGPSGPPTQHGSPDELELEHDEDEDDLDLDEADDDGPVFGDIPTQHSRPADDAGEG